jgi:hypothetical protein
MIFLAGVLTGCGSGGRIDDAETHANGAVGGASTSLGGSAARPTGAGGSQGVGASGGASDAGGAATQGQGGDGAAGQAGGGYAGQDVGGASDTGGNGGSAGNACGAKAMASVKWLHRLDNAPRGASLALDGDDILVTDVEGSTNDFPIFDMCPSAPGTTPTSETGRYLVRLAADGTCVWASRLELAGGKLGTMMSLTTEPPALAVSEGRTYVGTSWNTAVSGVDSNGATLWTTPITEDYESAMTLTAVKGGVAALVGSETMTDVESTQLVWLDASGAMGGASAMDDLTVATAASAPDGGLFFAGITDAPSMWGLAPLPSSPSGALAAFLAEIPAGGGLVWSHEIGFFTTSNVGVIPFRESAVARYSDGSLGLPTSAITPPNGDLAAITAPCAMLRGVPGGAWSATNDPLCLTPIVLADGTPGAIASNYFGPIDLGGPLLPADATLGIGTLGPCGWQMGLGDPDMRVGISGVAGLGSGAVIAGTFAPTQPNPVCDDHVTLGGVSISAPGCSGTFVAFVSP